MKIALIGCLHGKVPEKLVSMAKKGEIDYILSTGDYYHFDELRKLIFRYWKETKGNSSGLVDIIGRKRYDKLMRAYEKSGKETLRRLNKLNVPIITVYGNVDATNKSPWAKRIKNKEKRGKAIEDQIKRLKNIEMLEYSSKKIGGYIVYGLGIKFPRREKGNLDRKSKQDIHVLAAKEEKQRLEGFFKKVNPKRVILLCHDPPKNTIFDKVLLKESPAYKQHIGDFVVKSILRKYQPLAHISGHMHEHQGKAYLGKTLMISHGPGQFGKFAILELNGKIRIKFVR